MANASFDPDRILGEKLLNMDQQELCEFAAALCRTVVAEVGARGRRGGIYPQNISVDENGAIAIGPAGKSPWDGQEHDFIAPELYWNGQLSAASDVYSIGILLYYAVNNAVLPFDGQCPDPQLRRMGGDNLVAPKSSGRKLGEIIEKCLRFKAAERYQTLEELRSALDTCVKSLYLSGVPSAEDLFQKKDEELNDIERMMVDIIETSDDKTKSDEADDKSHEQAENISEKAPNTQKSDETLNPVSIEQAELLRSKISTQGTPAAPKASAVQNKNQPQNQPARKKRPQSANVSRERKIAEEVKKRRRRPIGLILFLCAVLIMAAIVINALLKDFQQANIPDNISTPSSEQTIDPYASTMPPTAASDDGGSDPIVEPTPAMLSLDEPFLELPTDVQPTPVGTTLPVEHHYEVYKEDISWTAARDKCNALGGHLVVIKDEQEFNDIVALAEANGISRVWIGCHRVDGYEVWETTEGSYIKWARGEPTYVDTNDQVAEDYIMLWNNNGAWACNDNRDDPCKDYPQFYSGTMGYICEFGD